MHLQSWGTKLVQGFQEGVIPIFTKSWTTKNIFNPRILVSPERSQISWTTSSLVSPYNRVSKDKHLFSYPSLRLSPQRETCA